MKTQGNRARAQKPGSSKLRPRATRGKPVASRAKPARKTATKAAKPSSAKGKPAAAPARQAAPPPRPLPPPKPRVPDKQQLAYEEAVRLFQAEKFDRADALFQKAMEGPDRAVAHHAQVHSQICRQRLRPPEVKLKTAEDHYNYAVTMMNARRLDEASRHLKTALQMAPKADHLHYAMAATQALQGNLQEAYERLKTAIDLQPRNRILARGDADFAGVLEYPPMASLLQLQRSQHPKTP